MNFNLMSFCLGVIVGDSIVTIAVIIMTHFDSK